MAFMHCTMNSRKLQLRCSMRSYGAVLDLVIEMRKRFRAKNISSYRGPAKQILEILTPGAAMPTALGAGKEKGLTDEVRKVLAASDDLANVSSNQKGGGGCASFYAAQEALEKVTESLE